MRYEVESSKFKGARCDLDGPLPTNDLVRDRAHQVTLVLLAASLTALGLAGIFGLATQNFIPLLVTWSVSSPFLTLLVRKYIGPFDGWL